MNLEELHNCYAYSSDVDHAIQKIESLLEKPTRSIIGLTGGPGSGKSTLAEYLQKRIDEHNPKQMICLSMDGFHLTKKALSEMPNAEEAFARRGAPWTFDSKAFIEQTKRIAGSYQKETLYWPSFDHQVGDPIDNDIEIPKDTKVILIEGLYLLHNQDGWQECASLIDENWFLDTPLELAIERLAQRHMKAWGFSHDQAMERITASDGINARIVSESKSKADWWLTI